MNIILACSSHGGGGAERAAVNLANCFSSHGHGVTYFYWDERSIVDSYPLDPGVNKVRARYRFLIVRMISLARLAFLEKADWIIGFTDVANVLSAGAGVLSRTPVCVTVHSDLRVRDTLSRRPRAFVLLRALHKWACRRASLVVAVSAGARKSLVDYYGLPPEKVAVVYNPVLSKIRAVPRRPAVGLPLKIVAVGRLTAAKHYPLMFEVIAELIQRRSVHLTIFGEGEERQSLTKLLEKMGLRNCVSMPGFDPDVASHLGGFDVFLMTSKWEGFGNVLIEALDAGLPVVSTDCPSGPAEALGFGKYGTLVASNPVQIADAVVQAVDGHAAESNSIGDHLGKFTSEFAYAEYSMLLSNRSEGTAAKERRL